MKRYSQQLYILLLTSSTSILVEAQTIKDQLIPLELMDVKAGGEIGRRINITVNNNLLKIDADNDFLAPFILKNQKKDFYIGLGKLIDATVKLASYTVDDRVIALKKHLIDETISAQDASGYLGLMHLKTG